MSFALDYGYLVAFFLGLGYALVSGMVNLIAGGHGGTDGHDIGAGHDAGGHDLQDGGESGDGAIHFSPVSPVTISMFAATFGGVGLITSRVLHMPGLVSLPVATVSGLAVATAVFYLFFTVFRVTQGSSEARVSDLCGVEAEVITSIPAEGLGEIAYVRKGTRYTAPARSDDRKAYPANSTVIVSRVVAGTFCVKESVDEALRALSGEAEGKDAQGDTRKGG